MPLLQLWNQGAATVGSIEDLVRLAVVVGSLMSPTGGVGVVQDATSIPAKEDSRASDKSVGVRSRRRARGADGGGSTSAGPTRSGPGDCGGKLATLIARYHAAEGSADDHQ